LPRRLPYVWLRVRPVPSVLFVGWVHALILIEVEEGVMCVSVNVGMAWSRVYFATYLTQTRPVCPLIRMGLCPYPDRDGGGYCICECEYQGKEVRSRGYLVTYPTPDVTAHPACPHCWQGPCPCSSRGGEVWVGCKYMSCECL
jgi:hypothetical protein